MPKINAESIRGNRETQKAKIVAGIKNYVQENRSYDFTFSSLAKQAGMPRTSLYDYFNSKDELLLHMLRQELPEWMVRIQAAVAEGESPQARVEIFFLESLRILIEGRLELALLLFHSESSSAVKTEVAHQKHLIEELIYTDLKDLGIERYEEHAIFFWGLIYSARELALRGVSPERAAFLGLKILFAGV